jgi:hypothetical protein
MTNNNEIIKYIEDFNVSHNEEMFKGINMEMQPESAEEILNSCD